MITRGKRKQTSTPGGHKPSGKKSSPVETGTTLKQQVFGAKKLACPPRITPAKENNFNETVPVTPGAPVAAAPRDITTEDPVAAVTICTEGAPHAVPATPIRSNQSGNPVESEEGTDKPVSVPESPEVLQTKNEESTCQAAEVTTESNDEKDSNGTGATVQPEKGVKQEHDNTDDNPVPRPITSYMKPRSYIGVTDLTAEPRVSLSIRRVANGGVHLVSINKMPKVDGRYIDGKHKEHGIISEATKRKGRADTEFMSNSGLIAIGTRRKSKNLNEPVVLKCPVWKKNYEDKYFVVIIEPPMSTDSVLVSFQRLLKTKGNIECAIRHNADVSSSKKMSLDNYLLDDQVVKIIKMTWDKPVNTRFYSNHSMEVCNSFFSHPYPAAASAELGYPDKQSYYFTEEDLIGTEDDKDTKEV